MISGTRTRCQLAIAKALRKGRLHFRNRSQDGRANLAMVVQPPHLTMTISAKRLRCRHQACPIPL